MYVCVYHCIGQPTDEPSLVDCFAQLIEAVIRAGEPFVGDVQSILIDHGLCDAISDHLII